MVNKFPDLPGNPPASVDWQEQSHPAVLKGVLQVFGNGTAISIEYATFWEVDRAKVEIMLREAMSGMMGHGLISEQFGLPVQWIVSDGVEKEARR